MFVFACLQPPANAFSEDGRLITTPDHADTTFLTLLHTFQYDGLEMLNSDGKWQPVPCRKNALVMNIGEVVTLLGYPFYFYPSLYKLTTI